MKTPIKELINQLSDSREKLIAEKLDAHGDDLWFLDGMIHHSTGVITLLRQTYLDKEKEVIIDAYKSYKQDSFDHTINESDDERKAEEYYSKTFNAK